MPNCSPSGRTARAPNQRDDKDDSISELKCDTHELETSISRLGDIVVPVYVPRYATCHTSIVATGKEGSAPGELFVPYGVAIHEDTHQIFVANMTNDRVEVFSEMGEFLNQLGVGQLSFPYGYGLYRLVDLEL